MKLDNISVNSDMVKKVLTAIDFCHASSYNYI